MKFKHQIIICSLIIFVLSLTIFHQLHILSAQKDKPLIICTTSIIADVVENIGKHTIKVTPLMGPGIDPHVYKPVESDVVKISSADIIFYNGLHLEAKMADLFDQLARTQTTIAVTKDIPRDQLLAIDNFNTIFDPHVWFDINLWIYAVNTICQALTEKFPHHKNFYKNNSENYILELRQLLLKSQSIIEKVPVEKRLLITGHDAFSYFGRLYNYKVIGLQGISTESSPGAYDVQKIIEFIYENNIPAIFIESSIPIKNILAVQEGVAAQGKQVKLGGELYSDALGPKNSSGSNYINMIVHNVQIITSNLQE